MSINTTTNEAQPQLQPHIGLLGVVMFGAGTAIGVSIFTVLGPATQIAGSGLLIAMMLAALPMLPFALVYAFMGSVIPKSGASYEWPARFVSPVFAFFIAWLRIFGGVGVVVILGTVLVNYLKVIYPINEFWTKAIVITVMYAINMLGIRFAAGAQTLLMTVLLGSMAIFVGTGLPSAELGNIGSLVAKGWPAILAAVPLMISLFMGIESSTEIGEEVRDARKNLPRGIAIAVLVTVIVYGAVGAVALGLIGPEALSKSSAPLLDAARTSMGRFAEPIIVGAAVFAVVKTLNVTVIMGSRYLYAMGRSGVFPTALGYLHPQWNTPVVALALKWVLAIAGLFLPSNLVFLLLAVNIPSMLVYFSNCLSALQLIKHHPDLAGATKLQVSMTAVKVAAWLGMAASVGIVIAGFNADLGPYLYLGSWGLLGIVYWFVRGRHHPVTTLARS